jgi:hypothetical protein
MGKAPLHHMPHEFYEMLKWMMNPGPDPGTTFINPHDTPRRIAGLRVLHLKGDRRMLTANRFALLVIVPFAALFASLVFLLLAQFR